MLTSLVFALITLLISLIVRWLWKNRWSTHARVKRALMERIFSYSTTAVIDNIQIRQNPGGFLDIYADVLLHNNKDNSINYYVVAAKYNKGWIDWSMGATPSVDLEKEWPQYSGFEKLKARHPVD